MMVFIHVTSKEYNSSYWEIMLTMYSFVNCCNCEILCDILFMNETRFTQDGVTNTRILHSWVHENPHEIAECHNQHQCSVNLWCGVLCNNLFGPQDFFYKMNYCCI
jgi:hypothetical protein